MEEVIKRFNEVVRNRFYNQMADFMDHDLDNKLLKEEKELEEQIISFSKQQDALSTFSAMIEEVETDIFNTMIANLDSTPDKYETLYDVFSEFNNIHKSKIVFPNEALRNIKIN